METLRVKAKFIVDGTRGGCIAAPTGTIEIRGKRYRKPCNRPACRYCDPLRDALREAQTRNVVLTVRGEISRIRSGLGRKRR